VRTCLWIGDHHLVCSDAGRLAIVDTERATTARARAARTDMIGDRRSRVVVERRTTGSSSSPAPTARHASSRATSRSPRRRRISARWRCGAAYALELWTPSAYAADRADPDRHERARATVELRETRSAAMHRDEIRRWRVQGGRVVDDGRWPRHDDSSVTIAAGHLQPRRCRAAHHRRADPQRLDRPMSVFPTRGALRARVDGGLGCSMARAGSGSGPTRRGSSAWTSRSTVGS